jgi:hypothetical protein
LGSGIYIFISVDIFFFLKNKLKGERFIFEVLILCVNLFSQSLFSVDGVAVIIIVLFYLFHRFLYEPIVHDDVLIFLVFLVLYTQNDTVMQGFQLALNHFSCGWWYSGKVTRISKLF